ncbi:unnamed protein product [Adineta steineri]|uniref:Apple domain-containing protein n=1 Tax=Adineta steineri TaxID=433720 RepID=A0A815SRS0_9BILA|nr:unnamed protein product [Adineta steineri]CAF1643068.1 unnamed protein product [Adineta steineri]
MVSSYRHLLFTLFILITSQTLETTTNIWQSFFDVSNLGLEFSPADEQALLLLDTTARSLLNCAQMCQMIARCRTFNYDIQMKHCRLYQGDIDSTGEVVPSVSSESVCGSIKLIMENFADYGGPCSICDGSRYLTCINFTCQCQPNTFFNGSMCRSQKLIGGGCTSDNQCRHDLNLKCLLNNQCGYNLTMNYTITTTLTTWTGSNSSTSSSSTTSTTGSSSSTTSTTTGTSSTTSTTTSSSSTTSETTSSSSTTSTTTSTSSTTSTTTSSSSTTSTTTSSSTTTSTTTSTTSTTSTTTSTTSTTTTTRLPCNSSCTNQTWYSLSNRLARWPFDGSFLDQMNNYNATLTNNIMSFITSGYINQALIFNTSSNPPLTTSYIPLQSSSFTIDTWLYITTLASSVTYYPIFGICPQFASYQCLMCIIHQSNSAFYLYLGFYNHDCIGITPLTVNTWIHAAFVFDLTALTQNVYLNGVLDSTCIVSSGYTGGIYNTTIGDIPLFTTAGGASPFQGYMDQMTVSNRAKSSCEILEIATLVAYFTFDNGLFLNDSGPNSLQATTNSTSSTASGRFSQAISFTGSNSSYFQMSDFTALGISNRPFSISLWVRPISLRGIIVLISSTSAGYGYCSPHFGFSINGTVMAQIYNGTGFVAVTDSTHSVATSVWSHLVQTWSSTNGIRLYINNVLVASNLISAGSYSGSGSPHYITLANSLSAPSSCFGNQVTAMPFHGDIDDFRVYSRELSTNDVCTLYSN